MAPLEPILQDNKDRFVIFPVKHHDIWDLYKQIEANFWTTEHIDLQAATAEDYQKLSAGEQTFIRHQLTFFATTNGIISEILTKKVENEVQYPEAKSFYKFQLMMEQIHLETYSMLIETYLKDAQEKNQIFEAPEAFKKKMQWIQKWEKSGPFAERLVAFAAVQDIFFSGAICSLFWLKKQEHMPMLTFTTELISRDQVNFSNFAVHLHNNHLLNKVPKKRIQEIILEAHNLERELTDKILQPGLMGIDPETMLQYLDYIADGLLVKLGCDKAFGVDNPFDLMQNEESKDALLQKRVGALQKAGTNQKNINKLS